MSLFKTIHEKKSARITAAIMTLLLLLLFLFGLPYLDPPLEYGLTVNFGTSDTGEGKLQQASMLPENLTPNQEKTSESNSSALVTDSEEVITQDKPEDVVIKKEPKQPSEAEKLAESKAKKEAEERARLESEQNLKKAKLDNLLGKIENPSANQSGQGITDGKSDQGKPNGDPYAPAYFGITGSGQGGVGYGLNGRGKPSNSKVKPNCDEEGTVVVEIQVNRSGQVVKAIPGKRGTNGDICLYNAAEQTALTYRWSADPKAPPIQIGFVIVNFSVTQ
jgi:colicin import membrane protein